MLLKVLWLMHAVALSVLSKSMSVGQYVSQKIWPHPSFYPKYSIYKGYRLDILTFSGAASTSAINVHAILHMPPSMPHPPLKRCPLDIIFERSPTRVSVRGHSIFENLGPAGTPGHCFSRKNVRHAIIHRRTHSSRKNVRHTINARAFAVKGTINVGHALSV